MNPSPYTYPGLRLPNVQMQIGEIKDKDLHMTIETIITACTNVLNHLNYTKYTRVDLISKSRKREVVVIRQCAMWYLKKYTALSLKQIGYKFGGRHHSTAIHGIQTWQDLIDTSKSLKKAHTGVLKEVQRLNVSDELKMLTVIK